MNRFAATTPTAIAKALTAAASEQMLTVCPISGLVVPNNFPPYLGALFTGTVHPVVAEAANLVKLGDDYFKLLSNEQLSGLVLALLHSYKKLELVGPAFLVRAAIEKTCTGAQLVLFLKWFAKAVVTSRRYQAKLSLSVGLDEHTFDQYIKKWQSTETYFGQVEQLIADLKPNKTEEVAFLSNASQAKKLNKACKDAFKEVALYLPKPMREKMKPFIEDLATTTALPRLHKMIEAMKGAVGFEEELLAESEEVEALKEFIEVLELKREQAKELGLDKDEWQFDSLDEAIQANKTVKAVEQYHKDVPGLGLVAQAASSEVVAEEIKQPVATSKPSFAERMAAMKAKGGK